MSTKANTVLMLCGDNKHYQLGEKSNINNYFQSIICPSIISHINISEISIILIIFWFSFANKKARSKDQYLSQTQLNQIRNRFDEYRKEDRKDMQKLINEIRNDIQRSIDELKDDIQKTKDELTGKLFIVSSDLNMLVDILSHNYAIGKLLSRITCKRFSYFIIKKINNLLLRSDL